MRFLLTPVGSSGDVFPYLGIGRRLRERGHTVTLLTAEPFREAAGRAGLAFVSTQSREDFERLTQHPDLWHPTRGLHILMSALAAGLQHGYEAIVDSWTPGTVLVGHTIAFHTRVFEETHDAPAVTLHLAPSAFRTLHNMPTPWPPLDMTRTPRWVKRLIWSIVDRRFADPAIVPALNDLRRSVGLSPVSRVFRDWLHSPQRVIGLFPPWFAPPQPDWAPQTVLTGFPLYDDPGAPEPPPGLHTFLTEGPPPVLFVAGTANRQAAAFFAAGMEATRRLGRRAVLQTAYREQLPSTLPGHVYHVDFVPFSRVLPQCAAIVHHGGIGTSSQGLAAGVPHVVMPMGFDQPDNAARLLRLGVADWLLPARFTGPRLAKRLERLLERPDVRSACERRAATIRETDALDETCALLERAGGAGAAPS